jgi:hypothetical protein
MDLIIKRVSDNNKQPCKSAFKKANDIRWYVSINTIEELLALKDEVSCLIITDNAGQYSEMANCDILVYDEYIE